MSRHYKPESVDLDRRKLIAGAAFAPLALGSVRAVAQKAEGQPLIGNPPLPDSPDRMIRWAVVGLGTFGVGQVIPGFETARHSRMTAFISGNAQKARDLGSRYGVTRFYNYDNFDAIAKDGEIDCVYIVLPVGLHAEYTIRALKAGKNVLCEKPMASTSAECEAMIAAAKASNRQLGVAYRVHFEPTNIKAKSLIENGELGDLRYVSADHGFNADPQWPPHVWRLNKQMAGGGSMFDIGIYGINTSLMMLGDETPVEVSAVYSTPKNDPRFKEVEGAVEYRLRMANGITVQGSSSYCYSPYSSRQHYRGSKASIEMSPATTYYENSLIVDGNGPRRHIGAGNPGTQFADQIDSFSLAARANTPHRTPGEMGLRDIRIIEACYRSAEMGGAPVSL